jgi:hypothetical protein
MIEDETPILNKYDKNKILNKKSGEFDNGNKNNLKLSRYYNCLFVDYFEKIVNIIDRLYYHKTIFDYLKKIELKTCFDVGSHKGEFLSNLINFV